MSGKLTWWFLLSLTFACQYPCTSIIDPFSYSPYTLYFHNFRNRLTWPPRRLQMGAKLTTLRNYYGLPLSLCVRTILFYVLQANSQHVCKPPPAVASLSHKRGRVDTPLYNARNIHIKLQRKLPIQNSLNLFSLLSNPQRVDYCFSFIKQTIRHILKDRQRSPSQTEHRHNLEL